MILSNHSIKSPALLLIIVFSVFLCAKPVRADQPDQFNAAIVVSKHIKPYMEALEGLRRSLNQDPGIEYRVYVLEEYDLEQPARITKELSSGNFDVLVSIGPEAASLSFSMTDRGDLTTVYSMVHNPEALLEQGGSGICGVPLRIPVMNQLEDIDHALPGASRIGILFDPSLNSSYFDQAYEQALNTNIELVPLQVVSSRDIPEVLSANWENIDALWLIPDQTVISRTLIEFIIKEAILQGKPSIGYNRFFYDSGAALAFVFDFEQIGEQTGRLTENVLAKGYCPEITPAYELLINYRVFKSIDVIMPGENQ